MPADQDAQRFRAVIVLFPADRGAQVRRGRQAEGFAGRDGAEPCFDARFAPKSERQAKSAPLKRRLLQPPAMFSQNHFALAFTWRVCVACCLLSVSRGKSFKELLP